ncbi:MAG: LPS export ABC transporter periplasmic protein LptC [Deltaproteobacteria bacterium RBG_13_47_9]|nr:MAG: LPS export ABC transporter periplasmic protein LptC [Deltaproteobacteria bacterium RBG_13_47_9]
MKKARFLIFILMVFIGGLVLASLWVNFNKKKVSEKTEEIPPISTEGADMRLEKIRFVEDKQGRRTWELEAKQIHQYQDQDLMVLKEVKVTFYSKDGRVFVVSGEEGKFYQGSKNLELVGNVKLTSSDGYQLKTQSVSYHHSDKKVTTSDLVEIEGDQMRLVGKGMLVDMETKIFKVLSQVKTQWKGGRKG